MPKFFGTRQRQMLEKLTTERAIAFKDLYPYPHYGSAKNAFREAVRAHNLGYCPRNCPISSDMVIYQLDEYYYLTAGDPIEYFRIIPEPADN